MTKTCIFLFLSLLSLSSGWLSASHRPIIPRLYSQPQIAVIGGGWAGYTAAHSVLAANVTLLDASTGGGLAGGYRTPITNQPVEAGIHGFWREYRNAFAILDELGIREQVLGPYVPSVLVSASGRVALAPILGEGQAPALDLRNPLASLAPLLPPPLDLAAAAQIEDNSALNLLDRASGIGLLGAWADFGQEDPASWARYDRVSAKQMLDQAGVSPALYNELVLPLLHVLPMTTAEECSAAAALSCFHVFALASRGAFDVRWCRGSISELIFGPWTCQLKDRGVTFENGARVTSMVESDGKYTVSYLQNNSTVSQTFDAVIMAVGGTAIKRLLPSCPLLQSLPQTSRWNSLDGVTCVAARIFLTPSPVTDGLLGGTHESTQLPKSWAKAMKDSPVFVCGPKLLPILEEVGFCIYDLQRLQDGFSTSKQQALAVLEVDFFRADALVDMSDDEIGSIAIQAVNKALGNTVESPDVLEVAVFRARKAVSHFCVNSASASLPVKSGRKGLYFCGDWIDRQGHASWSTEKAVVTGRQAAQALSQDFGLPSAVDIIPAPADTPQLSTLRRVSSEIRNVVPDETIPSAPWALFR